ncbi:hypothetical protein U27_00235 [Candidatus Vecturithrix granuli]|uniref:Uncharacterized protein n=1 Tax=Vecturithrix granuli TaxID=1499967 RepID=A0A081C6Y9_VECG1|nr:hypothetical protein U27_00235 [Candidatus Vecturithrix granuli]
MVKFSRTILCKIRRIDHENLTITLLVNTEKGVPKQDIVLAFHAPYKRQYIGFAIN